MWSMANERYLFIGQVDDDDDDSGIIDDWLDWGCVRYEQLAV